MADIEQQLAALIALPAAALPAEWQMVYKTPAPRLPPDLLRRGIAYRLQERAYGKLPARIAREIAAAGRRKRPEVSPGTRLVREWNGRTIDVIATEEGMLWEGRTYSSLSAIAREVTGTPWSGPRFFGIGKHA
ncbi:MULTISPECIES: DUF2924 domain-containing protein [Sphingomonas]|uniref:DUF2924 domain-containing protein n=1 Tax=Sphingomonas TaxID=13687 RepID=UPI000DEFB823|nr:MULTISPECIES: DUF2924 domain-containing protein [Sphingomonas]